MWAGGSQPARVADLLHRVSVIELQPIMSRGVLLIGFVSLLAYSQVQRSPEELLKEALAFHQQGKLEEAIRDYDLFQIGRAHV